MALELIELYPDHMDNDINREYLRLEKIQIELEELAIDDLKKELFISTATYTLPLWAKFAGIEDNEELDIDTRRGNILSTLKVQGIVTVDTIKKISESYSNGECEVTEHYDLGEFHIKFVGTKGIPARIDEIEKTIRRVMPAHLEFKFIYTYMTWDEMEAHDLTWDEWDSKHLTWDEFEKYGK